ncbi:hypothetical protein NJC40_03005 [Pseudomonas sp. 21LCFQ02]|uniref:hypothetical protein n=1 Tax=Pseudomonas sp. 21LCFQ02 TaxID=2957505 RepID=UPI00209B0FCA|nr:hypothetical protein [Pseudomonas sp. 21LCFQ02]MCO8166746.1 hypothetical protein [Pseudomonas sp. 21LCFQ02]
MTEKRLQPPAHTASDTFRATLLALLASDEQVRQAISNLCRPSASAAPFITGQPGFDPERELLDWITQDPALKHAWFSTEESAERQLVRLIAIASQWDRLLLLWDDLATRCKDEQRTASTTEQNILARCLELHNLIWQERQASLCSVPAGTPLDPQCHQRGTLHGDTVSAQWLPGLRNAAGQLQRKPLVRT